MIQMKIAKRKLHKRNLHKTKTLEEKDTKNDAKGKKMSK